MREQSILTIDTNMEVEYIARKLSILPDSTASKRILKTALTEAARQARKQMITDNKQRYALKKSGAFSRESKTVPAKASKLEAAVLSTGAKHKLKEFTSRKNTVRLPVRAKVLKESPLKKLQVENRKAFIATMSSGHTGIFQRETKKRNPIKEFCAPSTPDMFGQVAKKPETGEFIYDILAKEVEKRIDIEINKWSGD